MTAEVAAVLEQPGAIIADKVRIRVRIRRLQSTSGCGVARLRSSITRGPASVMVAPLEEEIAVKSLLRNIAPSLRYMVIAGSLAGAGCKKDPAPTPVSPALVSSAAPTAAPAPTAPTAPSPAPAAAPPAEPAVAPPSTEAPPPAGDVPPPAEAPPAIAAVSVLATAPFLAAVPKDAAAVVALRSPEELSALLDVPAMFTAYGAEGTDYRAGLKARLGFDPYDVTAWAGGGLDAKAPIGIAVLGHRSPPILYVGLTDVAAFTATLKALVAATGGVMPEEKKVAEASVWTITDAMLSIVVKGKQAILIPGDQDGSADRLAQLAEADSMATGGAAKTAAAALGGGRDAGVWLRLPGLVGPEAANHPFTNETLFGLQSITLAVDADGGALRTKADFVVSEGSFLRKGLKTGQKSRLLTALTARPGFFTSVSFDPKVFGDLANFAAIADLFDMSRFVGGLKEEAGIDLASLTSTALSGDFAVSLSISPESMARSADKPALGMAVAAGVNDEAAATAILNGLADKGLLSRGEAGVFTIAGKHEMPALTVTVSAGAIVFTGGYGVAAAGPSFTADGSGVSSTLSADQQVASFAVGFDFFGMLLFSRSGDVMPSEPTGENESEAVKAKRIEAEAARKARTEASDAVEAVQQKGLVQITQLLGTLAVSAKAVDGHFVVEGGLFHGGVTAADAGKRIIEAYVATRAEKEKLQVTLDAAADKAAQLDRELQDLRFGKDGGAPEVHQAAPPAPSEAPAPAAPAP